MLCLTHFLCVDMTGSTLVYVQHARHSTLERTTDHRRQWPQHPRMSPSTTCQGSGELTRPGGAVGFPFVHFAALRKPPKPKPAHKNKIKQPHLFAKQPTPRISSRGCCCARMPPSPPMRSSVGGHAGAKAKAAASSAEAPLRDKTKQPHWPLASRWPKTFCSI